MPAGNQENDMLNAAMAALEAALARFKAGLRRPPGVATSLPALSPTRHSLDFRSVHWFGADHYFTAAQAAVVRALWEAWENGTPDLGAETLRRVAGLDSARVSEVFRNRGAYHPAWNTLIVSGATKGTLRLRDPRGD